MRRVMVAALVAVAVAVLLPTSAASAAPSPAVTAYRISCADGPRPFMGGKVLPQPWSSSYRVPDVSGVAPGAFISHLLLGDDRGQSHQFLRPTGVIEAPEGAHWMGAGYCVAVPNRLPVGEALITKVEGRGVGIFGYAYDPDSSAVVSVRVTVDGRERPQRFPADWRWTASPNWSARANDRGVLVLLDGIEPGEHKICLLGDDGVGGTDLGATPQPVNATIGCVQVVVK